MTIIKIELKNISSRDSKAYGNILDVHVKVNVEVAAKSM